MEQSATDCKYQWLAHTIIALNRSHVALSKIGRVVDYAAKLSAAVTAAAKTGACYRRTGPASMFIHLDLMDKKVTYPEHCTHKLGLTGLWYARTCNNVCGKKCSVVAS